MKLYRISRRKDLDPLEVEDKVSRVAAVEETIDLFTEVLVSIIQRNAIKGLYISRCRSGSSHGFRSQQSVRLARIAQLVRLNVTDACYIKVRDRSCRFIDFGQDYLVNIGLRHTDEIDGNAWLDKGVVIQDKSRMLVETDAYDL